MGIIQKKTTITVESKIYLKDKEKETTLIKYCELNSFLHRKLFNIIRYDETVDKNKLQREYAKNYNIPVRLFKSLIILCKAEVSAQKELQKLYIKETKDKIDELTKKLNKTKNQKSRHYLSQKINRKNQKLNNQKTIHNCLFGTKELYKKQWKTEDKNKWKKDWNRKRNYHLYFVGSKDESFGNSLCQLISNYKLRLTLPKNLELGKYLELDVQFGHKGKNYDLLKIARTNGQALTYNIFQRENGEWYVGVSFSITSELDINSYSGSIGIDLNYNLITTTTIKEDGNPLEFKDYELDSENWSSDRSSNELSLILDSILERAKKENKFIVIEDLDLEKAKKKDQGSKTNRKKHLIPVAKFRDLLLAKCIKENILLKFIDPSYTSQIAKYKYMKNLGRSIHSVASYVIGRRGLGFKEDIPPSLLIELQSGENQSVNLGTWVVLLRKLRKSYPTGFSLRNHGSLKISHTVASRHSYSRECPLGAEFLSALLGSNDII